MLAMTALGVKVLMRVKPLLNKWRERPVRINNSSGGHRIRVRSPHRPGLLWCGVLNPACLTDAPWLFLKPAQPVQEESPSHSLPDMPALKESLQTMVIF